MEMLAACIARGRALVAALILLSAAVLPAGAGEAPCRLRFAWIDLPPFQYAGPEGAPHGIDHALVMEAARRVPCQIVWQHAPRTRAFVLLQEGAVDALAGVGRTAERESFGIFSHPMRQGRNVLVVRKGEAENYPFTDLAELAASTFRLGIIAGSRFDQKFEGLTKGGALADNLVPAANGESLVLMLQRGRIDGFLDGQRVVAERLARMGMAGKLDMHPMALPGDQAFILFSRVTNIDPTLIARFDRALAAMWADGSVERITSQPSGSRIN